ncbi:TRAP transporter small permease [Cuneatibacter sp. NSJ-177]|uniref:TRAP transporter small permease n=1 Tax=Cuneatibacter sp. NSJ-177 TaxID=2931401 RepID=UPI001FCF9B36|nr:TRAP transporter small permease [Cuneatibacter sp. NSJ-177]MCJ7836702.1 TRAP transporter small permease [Cuneatibacter sp. NSJ-177]
MNLICKIADAVSEFCRKIGAVLSVICLVLIFGSILIGIYSRLFTSWSLLWPEELARFSMVAGAFVGGSVAMKSKSLVCFDFLIGLFHGKSNYAVNILINLLTGVFMVYFLIAGFNAMPNYQKYRANSMPITMAVPAFFLLVGGVFILVHLADFILNDVKALTSRQTQEKGGSV